jgi:predicted cupin superfamily sugar epimerase
MKSTQQEIQKLIDRYGLLPHPEGGFYKETYRSPTSLLSPERSLMTTIFFLLTSEHVSRFHRIKSDELWFFHEGNTLCVHTLDNDGHCKHFVGLEEGTSPQLLVPANTIFGSTVESENGYALVSCVVAPGFDFADFELFGKEQLLQWFPDHGAIIDRLG